MLESWNLSQKDCDDQKHDYQIYSWGVKTFEFVSNYIQKSFIDDADKNCFVSENI